VPAEARRALPPLRWRKGSSLTLRLGSRPAGARDWRGMALEGERTPARADRLDATAVSPPNRSGDRGIVYEPGLPESAPTTNLPLERVDHIRSGKARAEAMHARLTTGAQAPTLAAGYCCQHFGIHARQFPRTRPHHGFVPPTGNCLKGCYPGGRFSLRWRVREAGRFRLWSACIMLTYEQHALRCHVRLISALPRWTIRPPQ
jgi:hypothetical protein